MAIIEAHGLSTNNTFAKAHMRGEVSANAGSLNISSALAWFVNPVKLLGAWLVTPERLRVEFDRPMRKDVKLVDSNNYKLWPMPWPEPEPPPPEEWTLNWLEEHSLVQYANDVAITPNGKFVYTVNNGNSVNAFEVIPETGLLNSIPSGGITPDAGLRIGIHPSSKWLYISCWGDNSIKTYSIDQLTGFLTFVHSEPPAGGNIQPYKICFSPDGLYGYALHNNGQVASYIVDQVTGQLSFNGNAGIGAFPQYSRIAPKDSVSDWFFAQSNNYNQMYAFARRKSDGYLIAAAVSSVAGPNDFVIDSSGENLYVLSPSDFFVRHYSINAITGALTLIGNYGYGIIARAIEIDPSDRFLVIVGAGGTVAYTIEEDGSLINSFYLSSFTFTHVTMRPNGENIYATEEWSAVIRTAEMVGPEPPIPPSTRPGPAELSHGRITAERASHPTHVDIEIKNEMSIDATYVCEVETVDGPTDLHNQPFHEETNKTPFIGVGVPPTLFMVKSISPTLVDITFNENMFGNAAIMNADNYQFDNGLNVLKVISVVGNVVRLKTSEQIPGETYTLMISEP